MNSDYYSPTGRPFYRRLPSETQGCYQGNAVVDWLTNYWDIIYRDCVIALDDLPRQFNPAFCDEEWLDFIAVICGFTAPYWDKDFPVTGKRLLLANSYSRIWSNKGSLDCLDFILTCLNIKHVIITPGSFIVGESQLGIQQLGQQGWKFTVTLPAEYLNEGYEMKLTRRIVELFTPCWCEATIEIDPTAEGGEIILIVDTDTILDLTNSTNVYFINAPGIFRTTGGTFRNPIFNQEPEYLRIN